jgi:hypothetical protein
LKKQHNGLIVPINEHNNAYLKSISTLSNNRFDNLQDTNDRIQNDKLENDNVSMEDETTDVVLYKPPTQSTISPTNKHSKSDKHSNPISPSKIQPKEKTMHTKSHTMSSLSRKDLHNDRKNGPKEKVFKRESEKESTQRNRKNRNSSSHSDSENEDEHDNDNDNESEDESEYSDSSEDERIQYTIRRKGQRPDRPKSEISTDDIDSDCEDNITLARRLRYVIRKIHSIENYLKNQ